VKNIFLTEETIKSKIHKVYLFLALFIGMSFSLAMPLFSEPDGMFHYTVTTNIAKLSNDLSAYGESRIGTNFSTQVMNYQQGTIFEKYYKNKIKEMPMEDLPRESSFPSIMNYNFWGHLIPAVGIRIGHAIYPSIGVMIICARLFTTLMCSLAMFFIIRWVKAGKLLFFVVSLSPIISSSFASLSYDSTTYVIAAFIVALAINILVKQNVEKLDYIWMLLSTIALLLGAKTNIKLFAVLVPLVMISTYIRNKEIKLPFIETWKKKKLATWKWASLSILLVIVMILFVYLVRPTLFFTLQRIAISFLINISPGLDVSNLFQTLLVAPIANINYVPYWVSAIWYILLVLVLFSDTKYVSSPFIAYTSLGLFLVGFLAVYYSYATYIGGGLTVTQSRYIGAIGGMQGRYFTPTLLLLSLFAGYQKFKFKVTQYRLVMIFSILVIVVSNFMLIFGTLFGFYNLS